MKDLKEIRLNETNLILDGNKVVGGVLPMKIAELTRTITVKGDTLVDGPTYTAKLVIEKGDAEFKGAVFSEKEIYINSDATGQVIFRKSIASSKAVTARANNIRLTFCSDINAKQVTLKNAFVAGSIYSDEIMLENCVVIGGVFASNTAELKDCIVGTFNAPFVSVDGDISLLLPTAFSQEKIHYTATTHLYNLSLADLGGLFKGQEQAPDSGRIMMDIEADDVRTTLTDDETQKTLHSYTVVGKVLIADLLDSDKFQNHFLLTAAALGSQLLNTYGFGKDANGNNIEMTVEKISKFFFDVLSGVIQIQPLSGAVHISQIMRE